MYTPLIIYKKDKANSRLIIAPFFLQIYMRGTKMSREGERTRESGRQMTEKGKAKTCNYLLKHHSSVFVIAKIYSRSKELLVKY